MHQQHTGRGGRLHTSILKLPRGYNGLLPALHSTCQAAGQRAATDTAGPTQHLHVLHTSRPRCAATSTSRGASLSSSTGSATIEAAFSICQRAAAAQQRTNQQLTPQPRSQGLQNAESQYFAAPNESSSRSRLAGLERRLTFVSRLNSALNTRESGVFERSVAMGTDAASSPNTAATASRTCAASPVQEHTAAVISIPIGPHL